MSAAVEQHLAKALKSQGKSKAEIEERLAQLREPARTQDVIQDGDDVHGFIGEDYRPDLFRYSWIPADKAGTRDRMERQRFVSMEGLDVRMRGIAGGVIMARKIEDEAVYKAARAQRDHQRRHGSRKESLPWVPSQLGDSRSSGSMTSKRERVTVSGEGD